MKKIQPRHLHLIYVQVLTVRERIVHGEDMMYTYVPPPHLWMTAKLATIILSHDRLVCYGSIRSTSDADRREGSGNE